MITQVAIKWNDIIFKGFPGERHSDVFKRMNYTSGKAVCGFITSEGNFVDRKEGYLIALASGQIKSNSGQILVSEDIWPLTEKDFFKSINQGIADIEAGRIVPHEEVMKEINKRLKNKGDC